MSDSTTAVQGRGRRVRRLSHRPPLPKSLRQRAALLVENAARMPLAYAVPIILIVLGTVFYRYVMMSDYFVVRDVEIVTGSRFTESEVRDFLVSKAGVEEGVSLLYVDPDDVREALETVPEVAYAEVRRVWPNSLAVEIIERASQGILVAKNGSFVFDEKGLIFSEASAEDLIKSRQPVLSGFRTLRIEPGVELPETDRLFVTGYLATMRKASPELYAKVSEANWDEEIGLTLMLENGERFLCGFRPVEETGPLIETLINSSHAQGSVIAANLVAEDYITVSRVTDSNPGSKQGTTLIATRQ